MIPLAEPTNRTQTHPNRGLMRWERLLALSCSHHALSTSQQIHVAGGDQQSGLCFMIRGQNRYNKVEIK